MQKELLKILLSALPVSKAASFSYDVATGAYDVMANYQIVTGQELRRYLRICIDTDRCGDEETWEEERWMLTGDTDTWEEYLDIYLRPAQSQNFQYYFNRDNVPPTL
jgi:hypothetical protein